MQIHFTAAAAALALAMPAAAQQAEVPLSSPDTQPAQAQLLTPPSAIAAPATANAVLRAGAPVSLRLLEEVTTRDKQARVGQRVRMEIASPVEYEGVVVIPAGAPAEGEITSVRNKGMWGRSGHLGARVLWARVNGRQIRLSGTFDDKGITGTGGVVASIALVPIAGFFVTGTSAVLPMGGEVAGFLDEDIELAIRAAPPAPMVVHARAPLIVETPSATMASE